jgi:ribosomal-protein-alanine N-acetyltransferase
MGERDVAATIGRYDDVRVGREGAYQRHRRRVAVRHNECFHDLPFRERMVTSAGRARNRNSGPYHWFMSRDAPSRHYRLRPMLLSDAEAVSAIEVRSFQSSWPATAFEHELTENPTARYVVLEDASDGVVAFGGMWLQFDQAHIVTVAVLPERRRQGLASIVVQALLELAAEHAMADVTLEVRVSNEAARALYRRHGFFEVGDRRRYYADNGEDAVIMTTRKLTSPAHQELLAHRKAETEERVGPVAVAGMPG